MAMIAYLFLRLKKAKLRTVRMDFTNKIMFICLGFSEQTVFPVLQTIWWCRVKKAGKNPNCHMKWLFSRLLSFANKAWYVKNYGFIVTFEKALVVSANTS